MSPHGAAILEEARAYAKRLVALGMAEADAISKAADYFGFSPSDLSTNQ